MDKTGDFGQHEPQAPVPRLIRRRTELASLAAIALIVGSAVLSLSPPLSAHALTQSASRVTSEHLGAGIDQAELGMVVKVRTSIIARGAENGQSTIDAGGQVAVRWAGYGTIVSAHNTSDARALLLQRGDIVTFTGAVTGRYRVTGSVTVEKDASASSVATLGAAMMMQTCFFNSETMRVVGMVPA